MEYLRGGVLQIGEKEKKRRNWILKIQQQEMKSRHPYRDLKLLQDAVIQFPPESVLAPTGKRAEINSDLLIDRQLTRTHWHSQSPIILDLIKPPDAVASSRGIYSSVLNSAIPFVIDDHLDGPGLAEDRTIVRHG